MLETKYLRCNTIPHLTYFPQSQANLGSIVIWEYNSNLYSQIFAAKFIVQFNLEVFSQVQLFRNISKAGKLTGQLDNVIHRIVQNIKTWFTTLKHTNFTRSIQLQTFNLGSHRADTKTPSYHPTCGNRQPSHQGQFQVYKVNPLILAFMGKIMLSKGSFKCIKLTP